MQLNIFRNLKLNNKSTKALNQTTIDASNNQGISNIIFT